MAKHPKNWFDDNTNNIDNNESIWVSKSEIKRKGRRHQLQFIGKLLRTQDPQPIYDTLAKLNNRHNQQITILHKLEALCNQLLKHGNNAIADVICLFPLADRQQLRTLIRNYKKEREANKPVKAYRQLFQYLKVLSESA
ncbi:MAG TPA: ribosome biogenesis factor YjgA [Arsenophonus sp.]